MHSFFLPPDAHKRTMAYREDACYFVWNHQETDGGWLRGLCPADCFKANRHSLVFFEFGLVNSNHVEWGKCNVRWSQIIKQ